MSRFNPDPLAVVERGLAVFPLPPRGRVPTLKDWPNRCISDPEVILKHWPDNSNIGVGMLASNAIGIDLDRNHNEADGIEEFAKLCERHGQPDPQTFETESPRGGRHKYFWAPAGRTFGNTTGRLGPGIDTRGPGRGNGGGYLIGPGSVVNGKTYTVVRDTSIQVLPEWLADLLDPPRREPKTVDTSATVGHRYVLSALQGEVQRLLDTREGGRNNQLNASAFALGQFVGAYLLSQTTAESALRAAADAIGLVNDDGPRQVEATIASGLGAGIRNPRYVRGI